MELAMNEAHVAQLVAEMQNSIGGLYVLIFFTSLIALYAWVNRRFGMRIAMAHRKREIEHAMYSGMVDQRIKQDVVADMFEEELRRRYRASHDG
jgi:cell division protein FtsX